MYIVYPMRPSPLRHTLAVLRTTIGKSQKEMADLLGCSTRSIQAIELGQLKLSDKLAQMAISKAGVDIQWLMENDVSAPIVCAADGGPYTKDTFDQWQAEVQMPFANALTAMTVYVGLLPRIARLLVATVGSGKLQLAAYRLIGLFKELERDFPGMESIQTDLDRSIDGFFADGVELSPGTRISALTTEVNNRFVRELYRIVDMQTDIKAGAPLPDIISKYSGPVKPKTKPKPASRSKA
jgi:transcriptional regulator with XRE-family HTH domain